MERARRLALGQWFTPAPVADLALALALPDRAERSGCRLLDPACGDGAFLVRAVTAGVAESHVTGIDVDPDAAAACATRVPRARVHRADAFSVAPPVRLFDAVVGNPPYVRQERSDRQQKQLVRDRLHADWPQLAVRDVDTIATRGDLAAAFVVRSLRLVRPGGRVALVVSGAMLDAAYADALWRMVAVVGRVVAIVDAPEERWFHEAAVNTIILVLERHGEDHAGERAPVSIARLRQPTSEASLRVACLADLPSVADVRLAPGDEPSRWSVLMRASSAWLELEQAAGDALVPLGSLAEVRRGVTSGANEVFYMTRDQAAVSGVEPAVLRPLVRSPRARGAQRIAIDPEATSNVAVVCPPGDDTLSRLPGARRYFERHRAAAARPTLAARPYWWALPTRPAQLFLTKAYASRFVQRMSPIPVVADQRVYSIFPRPGVDLLSLAAVLNSTFTALALESCGRASLGEGALEWTVSDARSLRVIDPRGADAATRDELVQSLRVISRREVGSVAAERNQADRKALDAGVAALSGRQLRCTDSIHEALIRSVARRTARADNALGA